MAAALGGTAGLQHLVQVTHEGSDAHYLRQQFDSSGSVEGVVDAAIQRFRGADYLKVMALFRRLMTSSGTLAAHDVALAAAHVFQRQQAQVGGIAGFCLRR
jgi:hypothetical protein